MIPDLECAKLCAEIYNDKSDIWTHFDPGVDDGVCWGLARYAVPQVDVVVLRGSKTFRDWIRDLLALALPFTHNKLGPVHPGFLLGLDHVWEELKPMVKYPVMITGHSLGAGRGRILAGLMKVTGFPPVRIVDFGQPKPGFQILADFLSDIPSTSYRNRGASGHDLVTDVPFSFPPEEYVHPSTLVDVSAEPVVMDWGPFSYHHVELYQQALEKSP